MNNHRRNNFGRRDRLLFKVVREVQHVSVILTDPLVRLQLSLWFLFIFMLIGIIGYMIIEQLTIVDALYMTVVTVTTVGFGDVIPTSQTSRMFTVIIIILGIGTATSAVSNGIAVLVGQQFWGAIRQRRMDETLSTIEHHYIVAGFGRIGRQIVRDILARGEEAVIIDTDPMLHEDEYLLSERIPYVIGDATDDAVLEKAGVLRARGFIAALSSDADNVLVTLTARSLKPDLYIVARAGDINAESKLRRAGADHVVSPYQVGGHRMAMALLRPAVHRFMNHISDVSDAESYEIGQIDVIEGSRLVGQNIITCDLRRVRGLTILAIQAPNGKLSINPTPDREFQPGDHLIVIGPPQSIYSLEEIHESDRDE